MLDAARLRADFPLLERRENGRRLVYLDNAATTQKPEAVLRAIADYYRTTNANVHRGAYSLAIRATEAYEAAHAKIAGFVNAWAPEGVVFTRGTTESINLVAGSYGRAHVGRGDTVVVTAMDHHSNLVPWQILCRRRARRSAWSRSRRTVASTSPTSGPRSSDARSSSRSPTSRTRSAP